MNANRQYEWRTSLNKQNNKLQCAAPTVQKKDQVSNLRLFQRFIYFNCVQPSFTCEVYVHNKIKQVT
jgi:hypothetical protein